jgi:O-acetyl-ADP-ribose deacetylase (regulator of RNase III)
MIKIVTGNIFEAEVEIITDANNSLGISGAGLARAFADRYPILTKKYNEFSKDWQKNWDAPKLLYPIIFAKGRHDNDDFAVCKFPTMIFPGSITKEDDIVRNLKLLNSQLVQSDFKSIALPALGCGIGRFPFEKLEKHIKEILSDAASTIDIHLYRPAG